MLLLSLLTALACSPARHGFASTSDEYLDGMWEARALTVEAGLEEAHIAWEAGDRDAASALVGQIYAGSFEPELEPLLRQQEGTAAAAAFEYQFGQLQVALQGRDGAKVDTLQKQLCADLLQTARRYDAAEAVLD